MESRRAVRSLVDTARRGQPARLIVVTAFGPGYQTDDGIHGGLPKHRAVSSALTPPCRIASMRARSSKLRRCAIL